MTRAQGTVAGFAVAAALACVCMIFYAGQRIYDSIGPSKAVATPDGRLFLVSHGAIHVFDATGKRRETYDLAALGVTRTPSDLAIHRDGRVVIANPDGSDIARCDLAKGACERIDPHLTKIEVAQQALPLNSVKILIDEDRQRYFMSDNAGHKLVATDFTGRHIAETASSVVWYPNQLAFDAPGELRVADTNHHRIVTFDVSGDSFGRVLREFRVDHGMGRSGRVWPFDAVRSSDGHAWVLVANGAMKDADLIIFDAGGVALRRIDLGSDSDPFDIELWRDRMIVSDATNYRVEAVGLDGTRMQAFDDASFYEELSKAKEAPDSWKAIRIAAQIGVVAVPVLAIVVLWLLGTPLSAPAVVPQVTPVAAEKLGTQIRWLTLRPDYFETARRRAKSGFAQALVMLAVMASITYLVAGSKGFDGPRGERLLWAFGAFVLLHLLVYPLAIRSAGKQFSGYRLGASSAGLDYELSRQMAPFGGRTGRAPWRDTYFDGKRILAGKKFLLLRPGRGPAFFDPDELQRVILANIPKSNYLTSSAMTMRGTTPVAWVLIAGVFVFALWLLMNRPL